MSRRLRSGYTTGACAAAAAKAATLALLAGRAVDRVEIPFPDGSRVTFELCRCALTGTGSGRTALASVVKDAGDDPDVTNGAEIVATVRRIADDKAEEPRCLPVEPGSRLRLCAGNGIGLVTKPGLAVRVGEPAINPMPRRMIREAMAEAVTTEEKALLEVTISVPAGQQLAIKTLNQRLGIIGGLSILGTTGIVRPVSAAAWTATIAASLAVAREAGLTEAVLSTGRTSERAAQELLGLPEEAYAMMGDHLEFSLTAAARHGFKHLHLAAMWAKVVKAAMGIPQTHVRHGALETDEAIALLRKLGVEPEVLDHLQGVNTAREIYERLTAMSRADIIALVCRAAKAYAEQTAGLPVTLYLVAGSGKVVARV